MSLPNYEIKFIVNTRPMMRKGRPKTETHVFAAPNLEEALVCAKEYGRKQFHRRRWMISNFRRLEQ